MSIHADAQLDDVLRRTPGEYMTADDQAAAQNSYKLRAASICRRHLSQSVEDVEALKKRYTSPVFGTRNIHDLFLMLGTCIDPSDTELYCSSQLTHSLQVASAMKEAGYPKQILLVALLHDLGKLLLLTDEDPANVIGPNEPLTGAEQAAGLDHVCCTWNHDEFAYTRLSSFLTYEQGWLLRYHSFRFDKAQKYISDRDKQLHADILLPFRYFDLHTKSPYIIPTMSINEASDIISDQCPDQIIF